MGWVICGSSAFLLWTYQTIRMLDDFTWARTGMAMTTFSMVTHTKGCNCSEWAHYVLWTHGIRCILRLQFGGSYELISLFWRPGVYMPFILPFPSYHLLPFRFGGFTKVFSTFFTPALLESNSPLDVRIKRHTTLLTVFRRWFWPFPTSCVSFCGSGIGRGPK